MISAGLVSPDAAAPATWLDKIFWGAWAENGSAPLLNEYENYSKNTSFEELFEQSAEQWSDTCKTALSFWAFGLLQENLNQMSEWDYSLYYKINLSEEQTRIIYDDLEVATKVEKIKTLQVQPQSADKANLELSQGGYSKPPYKSGTNTQIITLAEDTQFVRVYSDNNNPIGKWFMSEEDITDLSALEIQSKYAIPTTPTNYVKINLPAGTVVRVGIANELYGYPGGGIQFDAYKTWLEEQWFDLTNVGTLY